MPALSSIYANATPPQFMGAPPPALGTVAPTALNLFDMPLAAAAVAPAPSTLAAAAAPVVQAAPVLQPSNVNLYGGALADYSTPAVARLAPVTSAGPLMGPPKPTNALARAFSTAGGDFGQASKFLGVTQGGALAAEGGLLAKGMGALKGAGTGFMVTAPIGMALNYGGEKLRGNNARLDREGFDRYDAGQALEGAGTGLMAGGALAGAATALGATGPVGWGILGLAALGYGAYKVFANDDDPSVVKEASENGARRLDAFAEEIGGLPTDLVARYAKEYTRQIRTLEDPSDVDSRMAIMDQLKMQMADEATVLGVTRQQQIDGLTQERQLLAQQQFAMQAMQPYIDQVQSGNAAIDAAYAAYGAGYSPEVAQLGNVLSASQKQGNNLLALTMANAAAQAPYAAADQSSYVAQLEQQLAAVQAARQADQMAGAGGSSAGI